MVHFVSVFFSSGLFFFEKFVGLKKVFTFAALSLIIYLYFSLLGAGFFCSFIYRGRISVESVSVIIFPVCSDVYKGNSGL